MILLLASCGGNKCYEPVYDDRPALSDTGYNTCKAILYNFSAYDKKDGESVMQAEAKPIKVCGYIHTRTNPDQISLTLADEPVALNPNPNIQLNMDRLGIPDSIMATIAIDATKKFYITGYLGFEEHPYHGTNFNNCRKWIPYIANTIDYHFE